MAEVNDPAVVLLLVAGEPAEGGMSTAAPPPSSAARRPSPHGEPCGGASTSEMPVRSSTAARSSRKNTRWLSGGSDSNGEGGKANVCAGFKGRKVYRCAQAFGSALLMSQPIEQTHCSHCDLGRDWCLSGEGGHCSLPGRLLTASLRAQSSPSWWPRPSRCRRRSSRIKKQTLQAGSGEDRQAWLLRLGASSARREGG